jgi:soluble lytic murein transglycosylase-like protein
VQNIFGGTRYIGDLIDQFGRLDLALWAYNAGPQSVKRKKLPAETKKFIPRVIRVKTILDRSGS